jgi:hypothetical protein
MTQNHKPNKHVSGEASNILQPQFDPLWDDLLILEWVKKLNHMPADTTARLMDSPA